MEPRPRRGKRTIALLALGAGALLLAGATGGAVVIYGGLYDVAATKPHFAPVFDLLNLAMRRSVRAHARAIVAPPRSEAQAMPLGLRCYRQHCVQCHGAPGIAPEDAAKGLMPLPGNLAQTALDWPREDLYRTVRHGIRMAGMPAWEFRMSDEALWATVAFLERLPRLSAAGYAELSASVGEAACPRDEAVVAAADPERGRTALHQYACITCHRVPGVTGPDTYVGPPLARMARRSFIAGVLPNTPENMVRWLREPGSVSPGTLMPDLGLTERDARDIAAYLATLE